MGWPCPLNAPPTVSRREHTLTLPCVCQESVHCKRRRHTPISLIKKGTLCPASQACMGEELTLLSHSPKDAIRLPSLSLSHCPPLLPAAFLLTVHLIFSEVDWWPLHTGRSGRLGQSWLQGSHQLSLLNPEEKGKASPQLLYIKKKIPWWNCDQAGRDSILIPGPISHQRNGDLWPAGRGSEVDTCVLCGHLNKTA